MSRGRRFIASLALATAAAACGSSTTAPQTTQSADCQLTNGKVLVVFVYNRDRTKVPAAFVGSMPTLALTDHGDPLTLISTNPTMIRTDDYTWTIHLLVTPNSDVMSHSATVIDLALSFAGNATPYAVTGVTANGVQVRKVSPPPVASLPFPVDIGYFGVDACGNVSV